MANGDSFLSSIGSGLSSLGTGLGNVLSNPLAQAALGTYFGAIGTPRYEGLGGAVSRGGLAGLGALQQAQRFQYEQPILQAGAQQARAELQPMSKEELDMLGQVRSGMVMTDPLTGQTTPDAQGQAMVGYLESQRRAKLLTSKELVEALGHLDESKRTSNVANAQSKMMMAAMFPQLAKQMGLNIGPVQVQPGAQPQPAAQPVQPPPIPSGAAKAPAARLTPGQMVNLRQWASEARQDGSAFRSGKDNQWYQMNPDGTQGPPIQP